jgi:hypothetical protein
MDWKMNITNKLTKQLNMCELSIHNGKVILIDTDKCYDKKVGKMLKTNDNKYISRKVINNKNNKLYWRHLYSYLPSECVEDINKMIYEWKMKNQVLNINMNIFYNVDYQSKDIVSEIYDCGTSYRQVGRSWDWSNESEKIEFRRRQELQEKEDWISVDIEKQDIFNCSDRDKRIDFWKNRHIRFNERVRDTNKQSKKLQKNIGNSSWDIKYFSMNSYCCGLMNNGNICGCESSERMLIDREYFNNQINPITFSEDSCNYSRRNNSSVRKKSITQIPLCKRHYNKYDKMSKYQYEMEVDKIYRRFGYEIKNGYMCKVC